MTATGGEVIDEPIGFVPADRYIQLTSQSSTWLIRNILPVGGSMLIHAQEKAGKSALAIQLSMALTGVIPDWLGFPIDRKGRVLYLQVDTPRSTWSQRFRVLHEAGYTLNPDMIRIADQMSLELSSVNVLLPEHAAYLKELVACVADEPVPTGVDYEPEPVIVIVDTLRKCQLGDENSSTEQQAVLDQLQDIVYPSALVMIAHSKKPQMGGPVDLISTNRGSGAITAGVDAIIQLRTKRFYFIGRNIEGGSKKLEKKVIYSPTDKVKENGVLLWDLADEKVNPAIMAILNDPNLSSLRDHGRALADLINKSDDAAIKQFSRFIKQNKEAVPTNKQHLIDKKVK